ncbi:MAG TPA: hypothetical protein VJ828_07800, partial [Lacipirellulaceae bacterium]|nr:hypothetical protein [Lacipirellulaceae bacterium]
MPMGVFAWFVGLVARTRRAQYQASRWNRESLAPTLRVKRLEDRRVLNADAMPVDQLVVDAGSDGGDGQADTFHIEQDAERVRVSVNGQEVASAALSDISGISIHGSLDDDILMAEFKGGEPLAGLELLFDGGEGGNDSLTLGGEAAVDEISYSFGEGGENRIQISSADGSAQISYRGVEAVDDQLVASNRSFRLDDDGQDVTLDDAGTTNDDVSRLLVTNGASSENELIVSFRNPSESLVIDNSARHDEADSVNLAGLDGSFDADLRVVGSSEDAISIGGSIGIGQGDVDLVSGSILLSGRVSTNAASVSLAASHDIYIGADAGVFNAGGTITIEAPSIEQDGLLLAAGGQVKLDSGDGGVTVVRGLVDVSSSDVSRPAGSVYVLGSYVGLFDNAQVYAAAALGGGTVLIGGDYQGKNAAIRNAERTYIGANAVIRADAQVHGNGGKVVVWADEVTRFYGTISARGGSEGGDGGFAEVSGRDTLIYRGTADLRSEAGQTGTLLLDPTTLTIAGGTGDGAADGNATFEGNVSATDGFIAFTDATPVTVFESEIEGQSATANIILEATQTITTSGNFTDDAVTLAPGSNLTLRTRNQAGDGAGTINLTASLDGANLLFRTQGAGTITIEGSTDGGAASNISLGRLQSDTGAISVSTLNGTISLLGGVVSGGSMTVTNAGLFTTAAAGDITLTGAGPFLQNGAGLNSLAGDITTANQNITFTTGITLTGNVLLSTGAVGAGDITLATVTGTTAGAEDLTLLAGTGNITAGAIGATRLDDLQVTSANNATFSSVTADTFAQLAGTGTTVFNGVQNFTGDFAFTGNALAINQPLTAVAMTVTNAGLFTTAAAGDITLTGPFLQNGAGLNSLAGDITTADQNIT